MDTREEVFASARPMLFSIAYRMLGSVMDAEDVVQEAWLRWADAPGEEIRAPQAYLATIVTRLSINQLTSARSQRETYVGPWLPEPLVTVADASGNVELAESLSMAFLVLLERLSPVERAVFLLREVFDFDFGEIARIVEKSEANCRQLLSRARRHIGASRARFPADRERAARLAERFMEAGIEGDMDAVFSMLAEDAVLWADGGGKVEGAARKPVRGATRVAKYIARGARRFAEGRVRVTTVINGQPGIIGYLSGRPSGALIFDIREDRIHAVYAIANTDKLQKLPERPDLSQSGGASGHGSEHQRTE